MQNTNDPTHHGLVQGYIGEVRGIFIVDASADRESQPACLIAVYRTMLFVWHFGVCVVSE